VTNTINRLLLPTEAVSLSFIQLIYILHYLPAPKEKHICLSRFSGTADHVADIPKH